MTTIFICGNDETICDGYTDDRTASWKSEIGTEFVQEAARTIRQSSLYGREVELAVAHSFRDWHGGRFDQVFTRCGLLAVAKNATQEVIELAWLADEAGCEARDEYIAQLETESDRFAAEEAADES